MDSIDAEQRYEQIYRLTYPVVLRYCQRRLPTDLPLEPVTLHDFADRDGPEL